MKTLLMVAALLAGLAAPAVAGEATTTAKPPLLPQAAVAPSQEGAVPVALPQSKPLVVPMSVPLESNAAPAARGGGCGSSAKTVVDLTN